MENIQSVTDLNNAILFLENKQAHEEMKLKEQFHLTYESLKPLNIVKNIFKKTVESNDLKDNIVNSSIGISAGYISKMVFQKLATNPLKSILGNFVLFGVKKVMENNADVIKVVVHNIIEKIKSRKQH